MTEEDELGTRRRWLDGDEELDDDKDYIVVPRDTGWRESREDRKSAIETPPEEIREEVDDPEAAEKIIEGLREVEGTRVREELGPPGDEED